MDIKKLMESYVEMRIPKNQIKVAFYTDEYDDFIKNKHERHIRGGILKEFFYRNYKEGNIIEVGCGSGSVMLEIPEINHGLELNLNRFNKAKINLGIELEDKPISENSCYIKSKDGSVLQLYNGAIEDYKFNGGKSNTGIFDTILCWGSFCYFRSQWEGLISFNQLLDYKGRLIFDVATKSNLPIAQTVHGDSFCNMLEKCFGFKIIERREFGEEFNTRLAIAAEKVMEFDYRYLQIPFLKKDGKIGNFLLERDWYLG